MDTKPGNLPAESQSMDQGGASFAGSLPGRSNEAGSFGRVLLIKDCFFPVAITAPKIQACTAIALNRDLNAGYASWPAI